MITLQEFTRQWQETNMNDWLTKHLLDSIVKASWTITRRKDRLYILGRETGQQIARVRSTPVNK